MSNSVLLQVQPHNVLSRNAVSYDHKLSNTYKSLNRNIIINSCYKLYLLAIYS